MPVYKALFEVQANGFFFPKKVTQTELYKAPNIIIAKKLAEAEIKVARREIDEAYIPMFVSKPIIILKDIVKVED